MKKFFNVVAVFAAVVAMASCCGGSCGSNAAADSTKCCADSAKPACCDSAKAACCDSAKADSAKKDFNANDMFAFRMEKYTKELSLNDEQQAKLAEILTVAADRIENYIAANEKPSLEQIKGFRAEEAAKVKEILNPEQFDKFQKFEEERTKQFEERIAAKAMEAAAKAIAK